MSKLSFQLVHNCLLHKWSTCSYITACVVTIQDGRAVSATVAAASLCFCRLFDSSVPAIKLFSSRRFPPAMTASQQRYPCIVLFIGEAHRCTKISL